MKKLFSLLTAIVLCSSMTWADCDYAHTFATPNASWNGNLYVLTSGQNGAYGYVTHFTQVPLNAPSAYRNPETGTPFAGFYTIQGGSSRPTAGFTIWGNNNAFCNMYDYYGDLYYYGNWAANQTVRVKKPYGNFYVEFSGISRDYDQMCVVIGTDSPLTGIEHTIDVSAVCYDNESSTNYRFECNSANDEGYTIRISVPLSSGTTWSAEEFSGYNYNTWLKKNGTLIEIDDASGRVWTENDVKYFEVDFTSTDREVYHITNVPQVSSTDLGTINGTAKHDITKESNPWLQIYGSNANAEANLKINLSDISSPTLVSGYITPAGGSQSSITTLVSASVANDRENSKYIITATVDCANGNRYDVELQGAYCESGDATTAMGGVNVTFTSINLMKDDGSKQATITATNNSGDKAVFIIDAGTFDNDEIGLPSGTYNVTGGNVHAGAVVNGTLSGSYISTSTGTWFFKSGSIIIDKSGTNLSFTVNALNSCNSVVEANAANITPTVIPITEVIMDGELYDASGAYRVRGVNDRPYVSIDIPKNNDITGTYARSDISDIANLTLGDGNVINASTYTDYMATITLIGGVNYKCDILISTAAKVYHAIINFTKPISGDASGGDYSYTYTYETPTITDDASLATGRWLDIEEMNQSARDRYPTAYWDSWMELYQTKLAFIVDNSKNGRIPTGVYPVTYTLMAGTAVPASQVNMSNNSDISYYLWGSNGCAFLHTSGSSKSLYYIVNGTINVVNQDEHYYIQVNGKNSNNKNITLTIGSAPRTLNLTAGEGGSLDIMLNVSNWANNVHYEEGEIKLFDNQTITLTATPNSSDYEFWRWSDEDASVQTSAYGASRNVTVSGNLTLQAIFRVAGPVSPDITLCENCDDAYYNTFKANYNNKKVNVTYNRQFTVGRWSTMCLPFNVNYATMKTFGMDGCVYEFKYATGNANVGSGVNLYFSNAKSIEAGKCYIVNADETLSEKKSFVFSNVTIDVTADKVKPLNSLTAYNGLAGYKSQGSTIELVGTLRNGTLHGTATGNTYMGLKDNKIYYPNIETGSTIWAYRGIFRSSSELNIEKMRIIVDGEDRGELIIDADGEILNAGGDAPSRKFIRDGVLYIEREGVIYDAQGKRVEN